MAEGLSTEWSEKLGAGRSINRVVLKTWWSCICEYGGLKSWCGLKNWEVVGFKQGGLKTWMVVAL